GMSITTAEFTPDIKVEDALQKVREKFDIAKADFPSDTEDETIKELSFSEFPIMIVTLYGAEVPVLQKVAERLEDRIEELPGILDVKIAGGVEPQIEIIIDPEKLESYRLPVNSLIAQLKGENLNTSAGGIDTGRVKPSVRIPGEFKTAQDVEGLVIYNVEGRPVYLRDVATARLSYKDRVSYARRDGRPAVSILIEKRVGANIIEITDIIKYGLVQAKAEFPSGVEYAILTDASQDIRNMVSDLENNILTGLILVLVVVFLGMGLRQAVLVALALPLSLGLSFIVLQAMGYTMNMVVLFSLVLAQGMLVDNAVVIVENIYRHMGMGKPPIRAAREAVAEVAWPVIAATVTTLCAFGPMVFWPGIMGEFMSYLPVTVIITLLASLFVALVINPTLSSMFLRWRKLTTKTLTQQKVERFGFVVLDTYERVLRRALRRPKLLLAAGAAALVGVIVLYGAMGHGVELFPDVEPKLAYVNITAPEGTSLEQTDRIARVIESRLPPNPDFKGVETTVGGIGSSDPMAGGADATHIGRLTMSFKEEADRVGSPRKYLDDLVPLLADIPGAEIEIKRQSVGPPTGAPINIEITNEDESQFAATVAQVRRIVEGVPGITNLRDDLRTGKPELRIRVDRQKAALLGLNSQWIGNFVKMLINGQRIGGYDDAQDERDIIVRLPAQRRNDPTVLENIRISDAFGNAIPLSTVCTWSYVGGPGTVRRKDGRRIHTVSADVRQGYQADAVLQKVAQAIENEKTAFPPGFNARYTGENEDKAEATAFLSKAFLWALVLILLVLVLQFNSLLQTGIIMSSVIMSLMGVMISLIVLAQPFGVIMTGVAVVALAGVVVNNAIILIDYTNQLRTRGLGLVDAIATAGRTRLRPVVLTAVTTALGLLPTAMHVSFDFRRLTLVVGGESAAWWGPLATALVFGLMIATFLTLVLVPCAYLVTAGWADWAGRRLARLVNPAADPPPHAAPAGADEAPLYPPEDTPPPQPARPAESDRQPALK
ncbi:MAG: efflux RND transporter permease subunit, partial [Planctomycetes bacterium]|nr:efflux RND transporter permease subunit [Planctomycetota bacterium]